MVLRLLFLLLVLLGLHTGYQFVAPDIRNYLLEKKMKELVKERGLKGERELRRDTLAFAQEKNIPLKEGEIYIDINDRTARIAAHYKDHVEFWFLEKDYEYYPSSSPGPRPKATTRRAAAHR